MPWRALAPCIGGCGRKVASGRCAACRAAYERQRGRRQERGLDAEYERNRREVLEENRRTNGGLCVYCRILPATTADHVIPRAAGGTNAKSNLVAACRWCNGRKGAKMPAAGVAT